MWNKYVNESLMNYYKICVIMFVHLRMISLQTEYLMENIRNKISQILFLDFLVLNCLIQNHYYWYYYYVDYIYQTIIMYITHIKLI